jgi:hypothetical protein
MTDRNDGTLTPEYSAVARDLLGHTNFKFGHRCLVHGKSERNDARLLVLTDKRLYLLPIKQPYKVDSCAHILDIVGVHANNEEMVVRIENNPPWVLRSCGGDVPKHFLAGLEKCFTAIFPAVPFSHFIATKVDFVPSQKNATMANKGVCDDYYIVYKFACEYHEVPQRTFGVEDVIKVCHNTRQRAFSAENMGLMDTKDSVGLITALHYNAWFTRLELTDIKLSPEVMTSITLLCRRTATIRDLVLRNVGARGDFWMKLGENLIVNEHQTINSYDFSHNQIDEKAAQSLAMAFEVLPQGIVVLLLENTGLTSKACIMLCKAVAANKNTPALFRHFSIKDNTHVTQEGVQSLLDIMVGPNVIATLDLTNTGCLVESVFLSLSSCVCESLWVLRMHNNRFAKTKGRLPPTFASFLQTAASLSELDLGATKLPMDALKMILAALGQNPLIYGLSLNLASCDLGAAGIAVLRDAREFGHLACVSTLDLSDNDLLEGDFVQLMHIVKEAPSIHHLVLDRNLGKAKQRITAVTGLRDFLCSENSDSLESLSLADCKLKGDIAPLFDALSLRCRLKKLNISSNHIGDAGARLLGAALHVNSSLNELVIDESDISHIGFREIASGLDGNTSLQKLPFPASDYTNACKINQKETTEYINRMMHAVALNHSPSRNAINNRFAGSLYTPREKLLSILLEEVQQHSNAKNPSVSQEFKVAARDASRAATLMIKLRQLEGDMQLRNANEIEHKLKSFCEDVAYILAENLQSCVDELSSALRDETGLDPTQVWHPSAFEYESMFEDIVQQAVRIVAGSRVSGLVVE